MQKSDLKSKSNPAPKRNSNQNSMIKDFKNPKITNLLHSQQKKTSGL